MKVYTIGFTQKTAQRFFDLLRGAGVRRVIDAFAQDLGRVLALTGCPTLADVSPDHLRAAP